MVRWYKEPLLASFAAFLRAKVAKKKTQNSQRKAKRNRKRYRRPKRYSSFFAGSLGSAFSIGLRGSIWSRMAAS
jgi:hypothetical protein